MSRPILSVGLVTDNPLGIVLADRFTLAGHHVVALVTGEQLFVDEKDAGAVAQSTDEEKTYDGFEAIARCALVCLAAGESTARDVMRKLTCFDTKPAIVMATAPGLCPEELLPLVRQGGVTMTVTPAALVTKPGEGCRLENAWWMGSVAGVPAAAATAEILVEELGGRLIAVDPGDRALLAAAWEHATVHTVTALADATDELSRAVGGRDTATIIIDSIKDQLVATALETTSEKPLTGSASNGDTEAAERHLEALSNDSLRATFLDLARRAAERSGQVDTELWARMMR